MNWNVPSGLRQAYRLSPLRPRRIHKAPRLRPKLTELYPDPAKQQKMPYFVLISLSSRSSNLELLSPPEPCPKNCKSFSYKKPEIYAMHFLVVRDLIESAECQSETLSKIHEVRMTGSVCLLRATYDAESPRTRISESQRQARSSQSTQ